MDKSALRLLAVLLLIPSVFFGLMPFLSEHTVMLNGMHPFAFDLFGAHVASFHRDLNGAPIADSSSKVWVVAIAAEIILLAISVLKPTKADPTKLTING